MVLIPRPSRQCNEKWNYQNFGADWECECAEGKEQSPIDLSKIEDMIKTNISPIIRYYKVKERDIEETIDGKNKILIIYLYYYFFQFNLI